MSVFDKVSEIIAALNHNPLHEALDRTTRNVLDFVVDEVLMPEYVKWRDAEFEGDDRSISVGATGSLANVIARLKGVLPLEDQR